MVWTIALRWRDMLTYINMQGSISLCTLHFGQVPVLHFGVVRLWVMETLPNIPFPRGLNLSPSLKVASSSLLP